MHMRKEVIVLVILFCILIGLEGAIRQVERRLSGNINHIFTIPEIAEELGRSDQTSKILFLGNSLLNEAVDRERLTEELGGDFQVSAITPDGTSLWDWYSIIENHLFESNVAPDYIIFGFAWEMLSNNFPPQPDRLAAYFANLDDLPELYRYGMNSFAQISEFVLGKISHLFVNREAIRNRLMRFIIPHYTTFVQQANNEKRQGQTAGKIHSDAEFTMLTTLIEKADKHSTKLLFIAMPVKKSYQIAPELLKSISPERFLDYRGILPVGQSLFKDGIHLNAEGRQLFSNKLGIYLNSLPRS